MAVWGPGRRAWVLHMHEEAGPDPPALAEGPERTGLQTPRTCLLEHSKAESEETGKTDGSNSNCRSQGSCS
ncbi:hypothetical protein I79_013778 [Cricetulus griseus]|uniref:Uncharacterized protein n=1 Tax=Cricetulus griseus TaxID=10029 RepID=G3HSE7_CRIGR|nr:hypothetical protein I79_013778 [Cricetulus griseus]